MYAGSLWEVLPQDLGANAWTAVTLYLYEAAILIGWTPKEAFEGIRHCDYPWQSASQIKLKAQGVTLKLLSAKMFRRISIQKHKHLSRCEQIWQHVSQIHRKLPLLKLALLILQVPDTPGTMSTVKTRPTSQSELNICIYIIYH